MIPDSIYKYIMDLKQNIIFYGKNPLLHIKERKKMNYSIKYNNLINFSYYIIELDNDIFYELDLNELTSGKNYIILQFFKIFFQNNSIINKKKHLILHHFDLLNDVEQFNILYLLDTYHKINFIFFTNNIHKINTQIKSRCLNVRIENDSYNIIDFNIDIKLTYANIIKFIYNTMNLYNISYNDFVLIITKKILKKNIINNNILDESLELCYNMNNSNKQIFHLHKFIYKYKNYL